MTQLSAIKLKVSELQQRELEAIVRKHTSPQQLVLRAKIILFAISGVGVRETMRRLNIARTTVQIWRRRWRETNHLQSAKARLSDLPRSGAPATYTPEQVCAIVAIACERPVDSERPITHWTQREIAEEAIKRGIVEYISPRAIGHFLKGSRSTTTSRTWLADSEAR